MNVEDDPVKRSSDERERIFRRYELGRDAGADIDPWEDPGFEVYHSTDRYGFIHDQRLPTKPDPHESTKIRVELERVTKWRKMLKTWQTVPKEKLHRRVYKGIPNSLRPHVWCRLLDLERVKGQNRGVYKRMMGLARLHSTDARQIDSDVNRQFREHIIYRERYGIKQQSLYNVLTAYAMYNSEVGYCQGMSGLAGVLLMYMDEEDAFWATHVLLTDAKYMMHGLYKEGFPKLTRCLAHHDRILVKFMPKLKKHFDKHGLDAILYSLKWFFVCFVERVPFSLCLRVWDVYLLDGERVITAMAFTILKLHKRAILKLTDMDTIVHYIQVKLHKDFVYDDDDVVQALEKSLEELKKSKLDHAGPPGPDEMPSRQFGVLVEPSFERLVGRRADKFSDAERTANEGLVLRRREAMEEEEEAVGGGCEVSSTGESVGLADSKFSFDDVSSSLLGSRRCSLADTSVTSMADLSVSTGRGGGVARCPHEHNSSTSINSAGSGAYRCTPIGGSSARSTPRNPSPTTTTNDVVRIYVPYEDVVSAKRNGDNKVTIRIVVDTGVDEEAATPVVEDGRMMRLA